MGKIVSCLKRKSKYIKKAFVLYCVVCVVLILGLSSENILQKNHKTDSMNIDYGWSVATDNVIETQSTTLPYNVKNKDARIIELSAKIPPNDFTVAAISFMLTQKNVWVYYDGEEIYRYVFDSEDSRLKDGSGRVVCTLPEQKPEGVLKIKFERNDDSYIGTFGNIKFIDGGVNEQNFMSNYSFVFIFSVGLFITGLLMLVAGGAYMGFGVKISSLIYMSMFILSSSLWVICSSKVAQMFLSDWALIHNIEYMSLYLLPVGVWGYISSSWKHEISRRRYIKYIMSAFFGIAVTLKLIGAADFFDLLSVFNTLVVINILVMIYTALRGFSKKELSLKMFYAGTCVMAGFILFELLMFYKSPVYDTLESYMGAGFSIMITCMIASFVISTREAVAKLYEDRFYKEMAFTDVLTGLGNRTKFEADAEQFELLKFTADKFVLVVADANCLKKINDTMGHLMGDLAIRAMADSMRIVFKRNEGIYRTGGDEFCIVLSEMSIQEVEDNLEKLNQLLLCTDLGFPISMSYGFASFDMKIHTSIKEMYKEADDRMYEIKNNYKKLAQI
ncbi:sensor domain-containing diguanylate cyclase [Proteocatella sphenisci]|uniref:sensor domain-containing diguanylate cyclase n=1 Tax=Proteocatella sphenisci TaxID=181070 RepID=UPI00049192C9|nr:diguanylate cyclase [Proteocatella sphenisci]